MFSETKYLGIMDSISTYISKLLPQLRNLATLPITLTYYYDLSLFNYFINESIGGVQAVLDWDSALYLLVGSIFHFIDGLFRFMPLSGW
jgi:hypothetical protein